MLHRDVYKTRVYRATSKRPWYKLMTEDYLTSVIIAPYILYMHIKLVFYLPHVCQNSLEVQAVDNQQELQHLRSKLEKSQEETTKTTGDLEKAVEEQNQSKVTLEKLREEQAATKREMERTREKLNQLQLELERSKGKQVRICFREVL